MKRVLVLGGTGFIGRNIVKKLVEKNCHVTVADINSTKDSYISGEHSLVNVVIDDFTYLSSFEKLDGPFDEIYMLAAVVGVNRTLKNPEEVIRINTLLTMNTLEYIRNNPVKKVLFSSSSENYAGTSDLFDYEIPTDEKVPLCISDIKHPRWTYAITKIHGESSFLHCAKEYGFECTIVRYQNIIGPNMGFGHAIPHIVERFHDNPKDTFEIYGHDQTRAFCYIDDAVEGTILAMNSAESHNQIYHIGKDEEISLKDLAIYIGEIMDFRGSYRNAITYPGSVARRCPNIKKAVTELGYSPSVEWKDAVKRTVMWYKNFFESGQRPSSGGFEPPEKVLKNFS